MHIAFSADERYLPHAAALVNSLCEHNNPAELSIHFLCDDSLSPAGEERMQAFVSGLGATIFFHRIDPSQVSELPATSRLPALCWYRVMLPEVLNHLDRVLYLDTDVIVDDSLSPLWETDFEGAEVGSVDDFLAALVYPKALSSLELSHHEYFNSGVMLLNLAEMRKNNTAARILENARANIEKLYYPDQNALNAVLAPVRKRLSVRWNFPSCADYYLKQKKHHPLLSDLPTVKELSQPGFKPAIVHYLGNNKPWFYGCDLPFTDLYRRHRAATPWPIVELEGRTWKKRLLHALPGPLKQMVRLIRQKLGLI